jgi:hypothetical protein
MAGFLFKLEMADGKPGGAAVAQQRVPNRAPGHTIHFGHKTCVWLTCETTMPTRRRC